MNTIAVLESARAKAAPQAGRPVLSLTGAGKIYGGIHAIEGVDFDLNAFTIMDVNSEVQNIIRGVVLLVAMRRGGSEDRWRRLVGSTGRVMKDAAVLGRLVSAQARRDRSGSWRQSAQIAGTALSAAADAVASGQISNASTPELQDGDRSEAGGCPLTGSLAGPLALLREDARQLVRHAEKKASTSNARGQSSPQQLKKDAP